MPANPSLIDAMADAIREASGISPLWGADLPKQCARAALQSLLEAGPTEAMVDAGLKVTCGGLDDEANRHWQAEEFKAMLRAALEETGNG